MSVQVHKFEFGPGGPADVRDLERLVTTGQIEPDAVVAIIGKTEGNGGINDFTRGLADRACRDVLRQHGKRSEEGVRGVPMTWSGGTDGIITPHGCVFSRTPGNDDGLAVGMAMSDEILPEEIGRLPMVDKVAAAVREAMANAGIADVRDVHWVQTKTPLLTIDLIREARGRGNDTALPDPHGSMELSNGTTALGIGVALSEIERGQLTNDKIGRDLSLFSSVASCSSGIELNRGQVIVLGNRGSGGRYRIGHSVMKDALDADSVYEAIEAAGLDLPDRPRASDLGGRVIEVLAKCEADPEGTLRGHRQVMLNDSDVIWHHHAKAAVGGVIAAAVGDPAVFVSVAALHQGPAGGGPIAAIVRSD